MLYIVATPIGNLGDMTFRGVETLKSCPLIIAENPSYTKRLLDHFQIEKKKIVQFADHNEMAVLDRLVEQLKTTDACLVSDAGTPGISDPGYRLVRACIEREIAVTSIPGASAAIVALSASGLPTDRFLFLGFLPKTEPKAEKLLTMAKDTESTAVCYESPQRIVKTMELVAKNFPEAQVVVARELTKIHEEFLRGTAAEVLSELKKRESIKGEITLLVSFK
jgi:16S rRNA (cytidine1402-2'-O)-methyltransferase